MRRTAFLLTTALGILACSALPLIAEATESAPPTPTEAATAAAPVPSDTPEGVVSGTGTVTGRLYFPSSFLPPMRLVFFNLADGQTSHVDTAMNQATYSIDLPPGTYHAVAYPYSADTYTAPAPGSSGFAGGYTQAVPCGLAVDCTDHSLIPIEVTAGQSVTADIGDWYVPEGFFPPMPAP
jgi:hypothetical protein